MQTTHTHTTTHTNSYGCTRTVTVTRCSEDPTVVDVEGFETRAEAIRFADRHGKINPYSLLSYLDTYPMSEDGWTWGVTIEPAPVTPSRY